MIVEEKVNSKINNSKPYEEVLNLFENDIQEVQMYIDKIIKDFYKPSPSVYTINSNSEKELMLKFGNSTIPKGISYDKKDIINYFFKIKTNVVENATRVSSPYMMGHMTSALPFFHKHISKLISSLNQNVVKVETSSTMTFLERETLSKLHRAFYNMEDNYYKELLTKNDGCFGCITSGGTIANLTALWISRNNAFPKTDNFNGIEKEGIISALKYYNYNDIAIIGSELMHYSFKKAADILGIGLNKIYTIPVDSEYKIRIDLLTEKLQELKQKRIKVITIVGIASTTEVGSIDDLEKLADLAEEYGAMFHVDGAWGGSFILSDKYRHLLKGIQRADTITIDGHKLLYTPIGCGVVLFKSPFLPTTTIRKVANYIIKTDSMDHGKTTLEGSRPANALYIHASLNILGQHGLRYLLETSIENTKYMYNLINLYPQFEIISKPITNIFTYRYIPTWLQNKNVQIKNKNNDINSSFYTTNNNNNNNNSNNNNNNNNNKIYLEKYNNSDNAYERINDVTFNNEESEIIDDERLRKGFVSKTIIKTTKYPNCTNGVAVLRVVIANPLITKESIKTVIEEQIEFGLKLEKEYCN
ncbi:PLP-dependent transferase [Neocallimastix lanati (nom. inval.)]|nr:PLP-dependent transferase [Neocallimastix sp. JGI-2020a]